MKRRSCVYSTLMLVSLVSPAPKWAADRRAGSKPVSAWRGSPTGLGRGGHCFRWSHVVQVKRAKFGSGILPAKLANYSSACAIWEMKGRMLRFFPVFFFSSATLGNHDAESELENGARSTEQSRCLATKVASNQYFSVATAIAWMPRRTTLLNTIMKHRTTAEKLRSATHVAFMRVFSEVKLIEGSMCW